jgi:hypothetical protein
MTLVMTRMTCRACGQVVGIVSGLPEPGSLADYFAKLMVSAVHDPIVGPDEDCPRCGAALLRDERGRHDERNQ